MTSLEDPSVQEYTSQKPKTPINYLQQKEPLQTVENRAERKKRRRKKRILRFSPSYYEQRKMEKLNQQREALWDARFTAQADLDMRMTKGNEKRGLNTVIKEKQPAYLVSQYQLPFIKQGLVTKRFKIRALKKEKKEETKDQKKNSIGKKSVTGQEDIKQHNNQQKIDEKKKRFITKSVQAIQKDFKLENINKKSIKRKKHQRQKHGLSENLKESNQEQQNNIGQFYIKKQKFIVSLMQMQKQIKIQKSLKQTLLKINKHIDETKQIKIRNDIQSQLIQLKNNTHFVNEIAKKIQQRKIIVRSLQQQFKKQPLDQKQKNIQIREYQNRTLEVVELVLKQKDRLQKMLTQVNLNSKQQFTLNDQNYLINIGHDLIFWKQKSDPFLIEAATQPIIKETLLKIRACELLFIEEELSKKE